VEAFTVEHKLKIAAGKGLIGCPVPLRFPVAAIPELDRAAAVLTLRDGAFEVAVIQGVIFDLDREPFVRGIQRWAARHRP
jgi:hypothetical protein